MSCGELACKGEPERHLEYKETHSYSTHTHDNFLITWDDIIAHYPVN